MHNGLTYVNVCSIIDSIPTSIPLRLHRDERHADSLEPELLLEHSLP